MIPFPLQSAGLGMAAIPQETQAWSSTDHSVNVVITNSNRTATRDSTTNGWRSARSVVAKTAGKQYFEWLADTNTNGGMIGLAPSGLTVASQYPGQTATSWGYYYNSAGGEVYNNGTASLSGSGTVAVGSYARVAVDFDAGNIWFGNAAAWKSSGDPGAGTNPTFTFTPGTSLFMCIGLNNFGNAGTLRSTTGQVAGTVPTGFTPWDS